MATCADEIVLLADSRKFSIQPRNVALPLLRIGMIITDDGLPEAAARMLEDAGIAISIADIGGRITSPIAVFDLGKTNSSSAGQGSPCPRGRCRPSAMPDANPSETRSRFWVEVDLAWHRWTKSTRVSAD